MRCTLLRNELAHAFNGDNGMLDEFLTPDGFNQLFALLGSNQQGIGSSAISEWYDNLDEEEQEHKCVQRMYEKLEEGGCSSPRQPAPRARESV